MSRACIGFAALLALAALEARGGELEGALLEEFRGGSAEAKQRLIDAGPAAVAPLAAMLTDKTPRVAWEARSALRWIAVRAAEPTAPEGRRREVRDAVAPLLQAREAVVRRAAVEMLGSVGTDADVPLLAGLLADDALARTAATALSGIWGHAGKGALLDALAAAKPALKAHALGLIASHREADTLPHLVEAANDRDEGVRVAAVRAIGLLADPKGEPTLADAVRKGSPKVKAAAFESCLALAAARLAANDLPAAGALYGQALALADTDAQRAGALAGLGRVGDPASLPKVQAYLKAKAPAVRHAACAALCQVRGPAGLQAVADALPETPDELKPMLIAAIGARRDPTAARLLLASAGSRDDAVALAAVRALGETGDPAAASPLLDLARKGRSDAVKAAALRVALRLAHVQADHGQALAALPHFQRAFRLAQADDDRADALRGVAKAGDPRGLDLIRTVLADEANTLRSHAFAACLAIGDAARARGDRDTAIAAFTMTADAEHADAFATEAVKKLHGLGVHHGLAGRKGYITTWWIIGPFDCRDFNAAKLAQFPEREISLNKTYKVAKRTLRWKLHHSGHPKGWVDPNALFKPNDKVLAYAYTELTTDAEQEIELHLGRDDGLTLWLNGTLLYDEHGPHGTGSEDFVVKARLVKGVNHLLVKTSEGGGAWDFYVRITDPQGKPFGVGKR